METTGSELPIACSLEPGDFTQRHQRWVALGERALAARERMPGGVRLRFRALEGVEGELRELAALERDCCAFAAWSVRREGTELVLDVSARGEGVAAVRALFLDD